MKPDEIEVKILGNGYKHISFRGGFAQLPPHFIGETIPDEYIFEPLWNRERVNEWWKWQQQTGGV